MRVLTDIAQDEDNHTKCKRLSATQVIRSVGTGESTNQTTNAHEGDNGTLDDAVKRSVVGRTILSEAALEVGEDQHGRNLTL